MRFIRYFVLFLLTTLQVIAAPTKIIIGDQPVKLIEVQGGYKPSVDSRVTYIIGGDEFRPDGKIYRNGVRTEQEWSLVTPDLVERHHVYENLAREKNTNIIVNLNDRLVNAEDGSFKQNLDASENLQSLLSGYVISPNSGDVSVFSNGFEYRSDGKIYKDGQLTGGSWGRSLSEGSMGGNGLSGFLNGPGGAVTAGAIISVIDYYSNQNSWNRYVDSRREQARLAIEHSQSSNYGLAKAIDRSTQKNLIENEKALIGLDEYFLNLKQYLHRDPVDITIDDFQMSNEENEVLKHVEYEFSSEVKSRLENQVQNALIAKNYSKISELIEVSLNSEDGLLPELSRYTNNDRVFLPETINPSLGASPLSGLELNLDQKTQVGQVATRVANKIQTAWAVERGLKNSSSKNVLRHISSLGFYQQGLDVAEYNQIEALNYFSLSSLIIDSGMGFSSGISEAFESSITSIPILANAGFNFAKNAATKEGYLEETYLSLVENLPVITQAIQTQLIEAWDLVQNGSAYERSKLVGNLSFEVLTTFATGGSSALAIRGGKVATITKKSAEAFKNLSNRALGIKKSASWLQKNRKHFDEVKHLIDIADVDTIKFHGPVNGLTSPLEKIPLVDKVLYDSRGVPLPNQFVSDTFSGATYISYKTKKPMQLFKVFNGDLEMNRGNYFTDIFPLGPSQATMDLALHPGFSNKATHWAVVEVAVGTNIFEGRVASQIGNIVVNSSDKFFNGGRDLIGGGTQYYIPRNALRTTKVIKYGSFFE